MKELVVSKSKMSLMISVNNGDKIQVLLTKPGYLRAFVTALARVLKGENAVQIDLDSYETYTDTGREESGCCSEVHAAG